MPWCPKCKYEYRDGFVECSDCGCKLVDKLQETKHETAEYDRESFLISVKDEIEANLIESKLKQVGIPVMKKHRETGAYLNIYMGMTPYGLDIYVPSRSLELAKEIIVDDNSRDQLEEERDPEDNTEESSLQELENKFDRKRRLRAWIVILVFMPGLIWVVFEAIQALIKVF